MSGNNSGGIGVMSMLGVVFVALKLMGHIDWSWWYVTLPFWIGFVIVGVIGVVCMLGILIAEACKKGG